MLVCPDLDSVTYTLAGASNASCWGLEGETFACLEALERYDDDTWFRLGDRDLATTVPARRLRAEHALHGDGRDRRNGPCVPTAADDATRCERGSPSGGRRTRDCTCRSGSCGNGATTGRRGSFRRRDRVASRSRRARGDRGRRPICCAPRTRSSRSGRSWPFPASATRSSPGAIGCRHLAIVGAHPFADRRPLMAPLGMEVSCVASHARTHRSARRRHRCRRRGTRRRGQARESRRRSRHDDAPPPRSRRLARATLEAIAGPDLQSCPARYDRPDRGHREIRPATSWPWPRRRPRSTRHADRRSRLHRRHAKGRLQGRRTPGCTRPRRPRGPPRIVEAESVRIVRRRGDSHHQ